MYHLECFEFVQTRIMTDKMKGQHTSPVKDQIMTNSGILAQRKTNSYKDIAKKKPCCLIILRKECNQ